jgi:hypothetical protein
MQSSSNTDENTCFSVDTTIVHPMDNGIERPLSPYRPLYIRNPDNVIIRNPQPSLAVDAPSPSALGGHNLEFSVSSDNPIVISPSPDILRQSSTAWTEPAHYTTAEKGKQVPAIVVSDLGGQYIPTCPNTPPANEPSFTDQEEANNWAPHPFLNYALHDCTTAVETPALCTTAGDPIFAPTSIGSKVRINTYSAHRCQARRSLETPPPPGFEYNRDAFYVPYAITDTDGRLWPAKFVQVIMAANPFVLAIREGDNCQFGFPLINMTCIVTLTPIA